MKKHAFIRTPFALYLTFKKKMLLNLKTDICDVKRTFYYSEPIVDKDMIIYLNI